MVIVILLCRDLSYSLNNQAVEMPFGLESQYHLNAVVKLYLSQTAFNLKFTGRHKIRTHQNKSATQQDSQVLLLILREP